MCTIYFFILGFELYVNFQNIPFCPFAFTAMIIFRVLIMLFNASYFFRPQI